MTNKKKVCRKLLISTYTGEPGTINDKNWCGGGRVPNLGLGLSENRGHKKLMVNHHFPCFYIRICIYVCV
jgi:hypothetical protein